MTTELKERVIETAAETTARLQERAKLETLRTEAGLRSARRERLRQRVKARHALRVSTERGYPGLRRFLELGSSPEIQELLSLRGGLLVLWCLEDTTGPYQDSNRILLTRDSLRFESMSYHRGQPALAHNSITWNFRYAVQDPFLLFRSLYRHAYVGWDVDIEEEERHWARRRGMMRPIEDTFFQFLIDCGDPKTFEQYFTASLI